MKRAALVLMMSLLSSTPTRAACTQCSCTVDTGGLVFGPYNPRRPTAGSVATIHVTCDGDNGYDLKLSAGSSGDVTTRTLHNGASTLGYNLYKDSSRSQLWGDGSGGQSGVMGSGTANYNVYGGIFSNQSPVVGLYSDTLVLSVEY